MARPTRTPLQGGEHAKGTPQGCTDLTDDERTLCRCDLIDGRVSIACNLLLGWLMAKLKDGRFLVTPTSSSARNSRPGKFVPSRGHPVQGSDLDRSLRPFDRPAPWTSLRTDVPRI